MTTDTIRPPMWPSGQSDYLLWGRQWREYARYLEAVLRDLAEREPSPSFSVECMRRMDAAVWYYNAICTSNEE